VSRYLIVGLGNPGQKYAYTRHNIGFLVGRFLAETVKAPLTACSFTQALAAKMSWQDREVHLMLPLTYMNQSGRAVSGYLRRYTIDVGRLLVICDDWHLPFLRLRLRTKGSDGGHKGLASVIERLDTRDFCRLRMGIGQPVGGDPVDYVLGEFSPKERGALDGFIQLAAECCRTWVLEGAHKAMEQYNRVRNG